MTTKHDDLTPAEQRYLEHAREAEKQGLSLPQYYRSAGLSVYSLYNVRRGLLRKGVVSARRAARAAPSKPGRFVAVRMAESSAQTSGPVCRLRSPSGWIMECASWPPVEWMAHCFGGVIDAAP